MSWGLLRVISGLAVTWMLVACDTGERIPPRELQSLDARKPGRRIVWTADEAPMEVAEQFWVQLYLTDPAIPADQAATKTFRSPMLVELEDARILIGECAHTAREPRGSREQQVLPEVHPCAPKGQLTPVRLTQIQTVRLHGGERRGDSVDSTLSGAALTVLVLGGAALVVGGAVAGAVYFSQFGHGP